MDNSIVNYLNTSGQASDFSSRKKLAEANGISNYMGSADQNISLLNTLKAKAPNTSTTPPAPTNTQGAITVDQMKPATPIKSVTPPVDSTNYKGIIASASDSVATGFKALDDKKRALIERDRLYNESISGSYDKLLSKSADTIKANETAGVDTATEDLNKYLTQLSELNASASSLKREADAIPIQLQEQVAGQGVTDAGLAPLQAGELRKNALKALSIAQQSDIAQAAATGSATKLQLARERAQQIIDLKYKPIEDELAIRTKQYELNKDALSVVSKERTEALGLALEKEKTTLDAKKDLDSKLSQIQIEIAKNGAPADAIARIGNAKTMAEAITNATTYLRTPNTEVVKMGDSTAYLIDKNTGKVIRSFGASTGGGTSPTSSIKYTITDKNGNTTTQDYGGIVDTILASGKFTKDQATIIRRAIAQGEDPITVIKNNARTLLTAANQTDLENTEATLDSMKSLEKSLTEYYASGGQSSLFKGKYEEVINKLGEVSDPKLAGLAVRVQLDLQEYRKNISGTAFGIQEAADINAVFPSIKKGKILNDTIVEQRIAKLQDSVDSKYRTTIGDTGLALIKGVQKQQNTVITTKESLSDRDYVEKSLTTRGLRYDTVINSVMDDAKSKGAKQPVPVLNNKTGQIGWLEYSDYLNQKSQWTTL